MDCGNISTHGQSSPSKIMKRMKSLRESLPFARKRIKAKRMYCTRLNEHSNRRAIVLQNAQLPINRLPVELLVTIISFAAHPTTRKPYPYVGFSSVCHYWRSAILGTATFWKTIVLDSHRMHSMFVKEPIRRSRNAPLNLILEKLTILDVREIILPRLLPMAVRGRVKTLHWNPVSQDPCMSDLVSSFPALENIFFHSHFPRIDSHLLLPDCFQNQVKVMQIGIKHLGNLAIPGQFRELSWLNLNYNYEVNLIPLFSVLEALHNLPNLQFLRLFCLSWQSIPELAKYPKPMRVLTLPKLAALISNMSILHLIHAPKLLYLEVIPWYSYKVHNVTYYDRLYDCGFDFSRITHIWCHMGMIQGCNSRTTWDSTYGWNTSDSINQFLPRKFGNNNFEGMFDDISALEVDYPNAFSLSPGVRTSWEEPPGIITLLILCIEKTTNLVEICLNDVYSIFLNHKLHFLSTALRSATTVRNLIVLSRLPLQTLCDLLSDGNLVPNLERLGYTLAPHEKEEEFKFSSSHIPNSLRKLKERPGMHTTGLEIELKGFCSIQSQDLEEIEKLGFLRRGENMEDCLKLSFPREIGSYNLL
ncbi:hypothetical protein Clacol_010442 [Clathrus columnatus]|uniref:F-box domain-containing protein n=1 Tax=Clathrus columnatus TaxID=1419009 RepID=A0AAV5AQR1_9AGAM|nr:hypothetical protein Clacol_010442 [Clathrus columnatus]